MEKKFKKYTVEWSLNKGRDIDWEEFSTLRECKTYIKKHFNDPEKEDLHINIWERTNYDPILDAWDYGVIDSIELCEIGIFKIFKED